MKIKEIVNKTDLKNIKKRGIYKISYKDSDRIYIGSTSQTFYLRWIQHMWELKNGIHTNSKIMNVCNKYGLDSLKFEIVEIVSDKDKIIEIEQYYIDLYDSYRNGLNCSPSAYNSEGCVRSEETLSKYYYNEVSQYSQNGDYIKTFKSLKEASIETNTDYVTISNVCNGLTRLANKYQWRKGCNKENIGYVKYKGETSVFQYDKDGNFIKEWNTFKEVANFYKRPSTSSLSIAIIKGRMYENSYWSKTKIEKLKFRIYGKGKKEIDTFCN